MGYSVDFEHSYSARQKHKSRTYISGVTSYKEIMPTKIQKMKPEVLQEILNEFVGYRVEKSNILGNTIQPWLIGELKNYKPQSLTIDPSWRIEKENKIIASSIIFPWEKEEGETEKEYRAKFDSACELSSVVEKKDIKAISFCPSTSDIEISFSDGYVLRSFTTSTKDDDNWWYSDYEEEKHYYVSAGTIEVCKINMREPK